MFAPNNRLQTPECLQLCKISSIYKRNGSIKEFLSYRGIFRVQTIRNILELLIYYDKYPNIDSNLTEFNVGFKKKYRNNITYLWFKP